MTKADQYIQDVLSGKIPTGELVKLAINRHLDDLKRDWEFYYDQEEATKAIKFFQLLRHWKGEWAGEQIELDPHQQLYLSLLHGWRRKSDGTRRFRTFYYSVARKNGKTTIAAGSALHHLFMDGEEGGQVYFAATKEDQARIGFNDVKHIAENTPYIKKKVRQYTKSITIGNSFIKPLGSDSNTQDGLDISLGIVDEYHAHPTDGMLNILESGMAARRQPLMVIITTAGFHKEYPCYSNLRKSCIDVLRGIKQDDTLLAMIYEMDEGDDWTDEKNWVKANPMLGVNVKPEFLRERFIKAKNEGGSKEVDFKTKNLNIWTDAAKTWIPDEKWVACEGEYPDLTDVPCFGGLDLSSTRDTTAFVLRWRVDGKDYRKFWFFVPEERAKYRGQRDDFKYQNWIRDGYMIATPGDVVDYDWLERVILEAREKYDLRVINYDSALASGLVIKLAAEGIKMNPFRQGFISMNAPTKEYEMRVFKGEDIHDGNPVMRWMISNVSIQTDAAGNIKVDKDKSGDKVDGVVADIMSLGAVMMFGNDDGRSVYEDRGVMTLDEI